MFFKAAVFLFMLIPLNKLEHVSCITTMVVVGNVMIKKKERQNSLQILHGTVKSVNLMLARTF